MRMDEHTEGCPAAVPETHLPTVLGSKTPLNRPSKQPSPANNNNSRSTACPNHCPSSLGNVQCPSDAAVDKPDCSCDRAAGSCADGARINEELSHIESRFEFRVPGQHYYRGIIMGVLSPLERMHQLEQFKVRADDIIVSGYPKSGTTWLEEIVYLIQHDGNTSLSNGSPIYLRVPYLEGQYDGQMLDPMASPRVYKTHLPYRLLPTPIVTSKPKMIHILRNPRDIVVSYFHFHRTLTELGKFDGSWKEFLDMFISGYVCYGDWFKHTRDWWRHRHDPNVMVLTYEDMKRDLSASVASIAEFCGKTLDEESLDRIVEHTSFENMRENPMLNFQGVPNIDESISMFMRKGQVGDWKNHFTVAQSEMFQMLEQDKLGDMPDLPYARLS